MKKIKYYISYFKRNNFMFFPTFIKTKLLWKDKYDTPRVELCPKIIFRWLWFEIYFVKGDDSYWERWLWLHKYNNNDIEKAKQTWPWSDVELGQNSWNNY